MDPQEVRWVGIHWVDLAQNRDGWQALLNVVMNLWVLINVGNCLTS